MVSFSGEGLTDSRAQGPRRILREGRVGQVGVNGTSPAHLAALQCSSSWAELCRMPWKGRSEPPGAQGQEPWLEYYSILLLY